MKVCIVIVIFFVSEICLCQNFIWEKLTDENQTFVIDYIDTKNLDTVNSLIFFYIKSEYPDPEFHKRNLYHPDSVFSFYSANMEKPELNSLLRISFYKDGATEFTPLKFVIGCNLLEYGLGNLVYAIYYQKVTGLNLFDCIKNFNDKK